MRMKLLDVGNTRYGRNTQIYINDSFCPEYGFINYVIRQVYKNKHIVIYKVRNGVNYVKKDEALNFVEIGHIRDLENLQIPIPTRDNRH